MAGPLLKDAHWVRQSFLVKGSDLDPDDFKRRTFTTAAFKFTDTTPGGNFAINPPAQFTRHADPKAGSMLSGSLGMGRYYSEAIDDNSQIIHMRFGVPQFNSLTTFFTGFYNSGAGQLARTGRANSAFYLLGKAVGFVVGIMSWKLLAVTLLGNGLRFALVKPSSKYYYLKPAMPLYWNAVTTMVNHIAVNRGIIPRVGGTEQSALDDGYVFDAAALKQLHDLAPDIFKEKGGIDVYAMANKAQRLASQRQKQLQVTADNATSATLVDRLAQVNASILVDDKPDFTTGSVTNPGYLERWLATSSSKAKPGATEKGGSDTTTEEFKKDEIAEPSLWNFFEAELNDGSAFASFRVNSTGPINESFSSSVQDSEIAQKINGMSSQSRSTNFSFAGGNLLGGALGAALGGIATAVKDVASGVVDSMSISGLAALGGAAFVDIPKHWQSSMASLPRASYTIELRSPYGNPISQLINLHVPLAMLLAGALPISTGKQSYTSPFLVELYDQGRCQTRLGMIDSLSVTRGVGNLGFNREGHAMGIDVTFSVIDMSSVMHMPIAEGISLLGAAVEAALDPITGKPVAAAVGSAIDGSIFDGDNVFTDYMAVLGGMGLADQIYPYRKLKLQLTQREAAFDSFTDTSHFAQWAGDTWPARLLSVKYKGLNL